MLWYKQTHNHANKRTMTTADAPLSCVHTTCFCTTIATSRMRTGSVSHPALRSNLNPAGHSNRRCMAADFGKNGIGQMGITQLLEALKNNDTLETLVIDTNSMGDDGAEAVAQYMAGMLL